MLGFVVYAECELGTMFVSAHGTWKEALKSAEHVNDEKIKQVARYHHDRKPSPILSVRIVSFQDDGSVFETEAIFDHDD